MPLLPLFFRKSGLNVSPGRGLPESAGSRTHAGFGAPAMIKAAGAAMRTLFLRRRSPEPDLMKATSKKTVTVPGYTRADGSYVPPHQKQVHYNPQHSFAAIAAGGVSHSQKLAHKELSAAAWWDGLTLDDKALHVMSLATDKQDAASASAAISGWKAAAKSGKNPSNAQWAAFQSLPKDKQATLYDEAKAAAEGLAHLVPPVAPATEEAPAPKPLHQFANRKDGLEAQVWASSTGAGFEVSIHDLEEGGEVAPGKVYAGEAEAIEAAQKMAGLAKLPAPSGHQPGDSPDADLDYPQLLEALKTGAHYQKEAIKQLSADPAWQAVSPKDQHVQAMALYKKLQGAASQSAALSQWKKSMLAGKTPTPAQNAAYLALKESDAAKAQAVKEIVVADIGAEKFKQLMFNAKCQAGAAMADKADAAAGTAGKGHVLAAAPLAPAKPAPAAANKKTLPEMHYALVNGKSDKFWKVYLDGAAMVTTYGKNGTAGQSTTKVFGSPQAANAAYLQIIKEKTGKGYQFVGVVHKEMVASDGPVDSGPKIGDTKQGAGGMLVFQDGRWHKAVQAAAPAKGAKPKPVLVKPTTPAPAATQFAAGAAATTQVKSIIAGATKMDGWVQTGPQKGSNPGGQYKDKQGNEWYCKFGANDDVVRNEILAAKFYTMLGVKVPSVKLVEKDGKLGIASKFIPGLKKATTEQLASAPGAHSAFAIDAWLGNWDVVGLSNDNMLLDGAGQAVRVDVGGSLLYRAQGGPKGAAFGDKVGELKTLLNATKNGKTASVFKDVSPAALKRGAELVAKIRNDQIVKLVDTFGPADLKNKAALAAKLIARRLHLLKTLKVPDPWDQPPVDESKLKVHPEDLPEPINFSNYNGTGKGLSSKAHVNERNTHDDAQLIAFAAQGNLTALKNYQYDAVDKETGKPLGKKPITDHPSKDIKKHWAELVELLDSIAHPSVMGLQLPPLGATTVEEIHHEAGFLQFGERIATVSADKRLGFWMKLANAGEDVSDLVPQKVSYVTSAVKALAKQNFAKLSSATRAYIAAVQSTGWVNHVFSEGKKDVAVSGNGGHYSGGLAGLAAACYADAIESPEGTTLHRWMKMPQAMKDQLLKEKPGLILQNTDSMCCSNESAWAKMPHFGSDALLNIRYAKGAKALHTYASGAFAGENEITTLMGQRFVLLEVKKGNPASPNGVTLELLMLPPHEGFIADIKSNAALGKALLIFFRREAAHA